jgi:hypothetical protein
MIVIGARSTPVTESCIDGDPGATSTSAARTSVPAPGSMRKYWLPVDAPIGRLDTTAVLSGPMARGRG